jgi:hypothetical protein
MKFWEIPREKQLIILREDMIIKQRSALEFDYDLPKSHIVYETPIVISELILESYISDKHKRLTLVSVLDCLSSSVLETRFQILTKWGIQISLGRGEHIICKNRDFINDSKILYIDLESLTDVKFEEFHPYAQGTPARIRMISVAALFFYSGFLGNALCV